MGSGPGSPFNQATRLFQRAARFGESRHAAKVKGKAGVGIYSFNTMHAYINAFGNFLKYARSEFGVKFAGQVEPHTAEQYLRHCAEQDMAMGTLGKIASAINKADAVMKHIGWRAKAAPPLLPAGAGRHGDPKPTPFTPEEAQAVAGRLRESRDPRFAQLAMVQRYAGLRLREAVSLRAEAISERGDLIRLSPGDGTKNGKPRTVAVLSPDGREFFVKVGGLGARRHGLPRPEDAGAGIRTRVAARVPRTQYCAQPHARFAFAVGDRDVQPTEGNGSNGPAGAE